MKNSIVWMAEEMETGEELGRFLAQDSQSALADAHVFWPKVARIRVKRVRK